MINVFQPSLGQEELDAISNVFKSNWIGKGKQVSLFEKEFADFHSIDSLSESMISTTCATEALFSILEILKLEPGDEVLMPSIGFVATASAVCSVGALPVFADVDPRSLNSNLLHFLELVTPKTKAIIVNHYGGHPADVDKISTFCKERNIVLIEDSACAISAKINGRSAGTFGDYGIWSFDSMKVLVCGDGGMVYTSSLEKFDELKSKFYLGLIDTSKSGLEKSKNSKDKWWEYQINGYHRRAIMNDMTASIGRVQLKKLNDNLEKRAKVAEIYRAELSHLSGLLELPPTPKENIEITNYLFWVQCKQRDDLASFLLDNDVYTTFRYWPLHLVDKFSHGKRKPLPNSENASQVTLNLPCHQALTDSDLNRTIDLVKKFFKK